MADEMIKYRYCMTCKVRYKATDEPRQTCTKCGALLADTPTGARLPQTGKAPAAKTPQPKPVTAPVATTPEPAVTPPVSVEAPVQVAQGRGGFTCNFVDVLLCLLHNILTGIPVLGLIWCGISVFANPLKSRVSKGTIVAGLISNALSAIMLILLYTVFKG